MQKFLFKNFLNDPRVYGLNKAYWQRQIRSKLSITDELKPFYNTEYVNGKKFNDGNPICSFLLKNGKSVKIIQEEPESESLQMSAWINNVVDSKNDINEELVISLELTSTTFSVALNLIQEWNNTTTDSEKMKLIIDQYTTNLH